MIKALDEYVSGKEETKEELKRFDFEIEYIKTKWRTHQFDDPLYNPNLTLGKKDFGLKV